MRKLIFPIFIILSLNSFGQTGKPFIKNYPPNEYNGEDQIWTILQDQRGVMYFGGNGGLYEYNGVSWKKYPITDTKKAVLSTAIDENGIIYIGSEKEFGCMMPDEIGRLKYVSFVNELDSVDRLFTNVWSTAEAAGNVYFVADEAVYRYNHDSLPKVKKIYSDVAPFLLYKPNDEVFITVRNGEMMKIKGDKLISIPGIKGISIWFILPYEDNKFLIGSSENGLEIYNPNAEDSSHVISKYDCFNKRDLDNTDKFNADNQIYIGACKLDEERFAIGTIRNGIIIINKKGRIIEHINKDSDLQSSTIHYLFADKQNELWAGTSYGISRVEINSPFRIFDEKGGIPGTIYNILRFKNNLYATSNLGMYYYNGERFKGIKTLTGENSVQVFLPASYQNPITKDSVLLVSTIYGMYKVQGDKALKINDISPTGIHQSEYDKTKFYCSLDFNLLSFSLNGDKFTKPDTLFEFNEIIYTGVEYDEDNLWIILDEKPIVFNLKKKKVQFLKLGNEFEDLRFNEIIKLRGETVFITNKGIFKFDKKNQLFYKDNLIINKKFSSKDVVQITEASKKLFWTLLFHDSERIICKNNLTEAGIKKDSIPFKRLFGTHTIYADGDSLLWTVSSKKIVKYNLNDNKDYSEKSAAVITKIKISNDSIVFHGAYHSNSKNEIFLNEIKQINNLFAYNENNVFFEFALPSFDNESANRFSYILLGGKREQWSEWTDETYKEFSNLYEGKYIFKVKGKNIYGFESEPVVFEFEILPPVYRTWWAYILYVIAFLSFVLLMIKLNARRLEKENIRLDNIVQERTAEIYLQKEEIQTQADNLEEINVELNQKNEEISSIADNLTVANQKIRERNIYITDSINYARKIQKAILPTDNEISKVLDKFFVIYKPKDIVGGDFYFIKKIKKYIVIAVADSTGHGVPGGFLSMMGVSFLNEIVQKKTITNPNLALDFLRLKLKYSLRQKDYLTSRTDGIDMALCAIDTETGKLEYSGANIPLFVIRDSEIIEVSPDMQPVGIHFKEFPFTLHQLQLKPNDMIYLFSDGIYDQFGGKHKKKFLISNLKKLLIENSKESVKVQRRNILRAFNTWKGENVQVDDILIMGVRFKI